jgi:hypothetical protein
VLQFTTEAVCMWEDSDPSVELVSPPLIAPIPSNVRPPWVPLTVIPFAAAAPGANQDFTPR